MVNIYSLKGEVKGKVNLPEVFKTAYRPDLIQRSVVAEESQNRQEYSNDAVAGFKSSADYYGSRRHPFRQTINKGQSRLPREKPGGGGLGRVRIVPQSKGGHRSHPPKGKDYAKKINNREYELALKSAIAASKEKPLVLGRGHNVEKISELPIVVEDSVEKIKRTKDLEETLESLGLKQEIQEIAVKKRSGRSETRSRQTRKRRRVLLIVSKDDGVVKASANIPGMEATTVDSLKVSSLAPGTKAGRLTIWSESAIKSIGERWTQTKQ